MKTASPEALVRLYRGVPPHSGLAETFKPAMGRLDWSVTATVSLVGTAGAAGEGGNVARRRRHAVKAFPMRIFTGGTAARRKIITMLLHRPGPWRGTVDA